MDHRPLIVLMADDDQHDIIATKRAWKKNHIQNPLYIVNDGQECLDYLYGQKQFSDPEVAPRPDILLIDINMPKINGFTVVRQLREDIRYQKLPIIVLTTSNAERDKLEAFDCGVNAFMTKPFTFDLFCKTITSINYGWELVAGVNNS